jgi:hypothetical protein
MAKKLKPECFEVLNKNGKAELFSTDDVSVNKLSFTITNLTGEPLALTGGIPVKVLRGVPQIDPGGSSFNFGFESMLTGEVVKNLKLTLPADWNSAFFEGSETTPPSWSVAPASDVVIAINDSVKLTIENIKCSTTKPGNFEVMYRNIPGYSDTNFPIAKHLSVLNPPDTGKLTLPLTHGYINTEHPIQGQTLNEEIFDLSELTDVSGGEAVPIYITYDPVALIQNGFTLILTNTSNKPLVPNADAFDFYETAGADQPVVYVSFVFGDEDYAVTTQQLADNNISINVSGYLPWQPTKHVGGTAYWQFIPLSKRVMDGMETVRLPVKKIITPLNVLADTISVMYVQVNNVPGYNDAVYTLPLQKKKATASMDKFEVSQSIIYAGEDVKLTWISSLAKRVTISYKTRDDVVITLDSAKGEIKLDGTDFKLPVAPTAIHTVITARAFDDSSSHSLDKFVEVKQKPAHIKSFNANPSLVEVATNQDITLTWEVTNGKLLKLVTPEGEIEIPRDATNYIYKNLKSPFRFKLSAYSYYHLLPEMVTDTTAVFTYRSETPIPLPMPAEKMQPFPAVMINKPRGRVYIVNSTDNTVYDIDAGRLTVDKKYPGIVMLLSQNAEKLFVFNPEKGNFGTRMFDTTSGAASTNNRDDYQVAGPYPGASIAINATLTRFYCSGTFNSPFYNWTAISRYDVNASGNYMRLVHVWPPSAGANTEIFAIALNNTGQKLYVAYDTNITVWGTDFSWHKGLSLPGSKPGVFVPNKSGSKLYLACEDGNTIAVIDTVTDSILEAISLKKKRDRPRHQPGREIFVCVYLPQQRSSCDRY